MAISFTKKVIIVTAALMLVLLLLSGTLLLINRPEWQMMPAWLLAGGVVVWLAGWRKTR